MSKDLAGRVIRGLVLAVACVFAAIGYSDYVLVVAATFVFFELVEVNIHLMALRRAAQRKPKERPNPLVGSEGRRRRP